MAQLLVYCLIMLNLFELETSCHYPLVGPDVKIGPLTFMLGKTENAEYLYLGQGTLDCTVLLTVSA